MPREFSKETLKAFDQMRRCFGEGAILMISTCSHADEVERGMMPGQSLILKGCGKLPDMEFRVRIDGTVVWRYQVEKGNYSGFDGIWRAMSEGECQQHLRMGGKIADWLRELGEP